MSKDTLGIPESPALKKAGNEFVKDFLNELIRDPSQVSKEDIKDFVDIYIRVVECSNTEVESMRRLAATG